MQPDVTSIHGKYAHSATSGNKYTGEIRISRSLASTYYELPGKIFNLCSILLVYIFLLIFVYKVHLYPIDMTLIVPLNVHA